MEVRFLVDGAEVMIESQVCHLQLLDRGGGWLWCYRALCVLQYIASYCTQPSRGTTLESSGRSLTEGPCHLVPLIWEVCSRCEQAVSSVTLGTTTQKISGTPLQ